MLAVLVSIDTPFFGNSNLLVYEYEFGIFAKSFQEIRESENEYNT